MNKVDGGSFGQGIVRRAEVVDAAIGVFARLGYAGASMRELAAAADMEKGHLSYYFRTKESLLFEVITDLYDRGLVGITEWTKVEPSYDGLLSLFRKHMVFVIDNLDQTRVAYETFRFLSGQRHNTIINKRRRYEKQLSDYIEACRPSVSIDEHTPTRLLAYSALGVLNWPYQWVSRKGPTSNARLADVLAHRAIACLQPVAEEPSDKSLA